MSTESESSLAYARRVELLEMLKKAKIHLSVQKDSLSVILHGQIAELIKETEGK